MIIIIIINVINIICARPLIIIIMILNILTWGSRPCSISFPLVRSTTPRSQVQPRTRSTENCVFNISPLNIFCLVLAALKMIKNNFLLNLFCLLHWKFCLHFYFFVRCTGARSFMFHCHWIFVLFQNEQYLSLHLTFQKFNTHVFFKNPQKIVFQHNDLQKKLSSTTVAEKVVHLQKKSLG